MANDDQNDDDHDEEPGRLRGMYEDEKRQRAEAQTQLLALQRKEAFRDAGLDPSKPLHKTLMSAYDGELEPDKVKAWADELGINEPAEPPSPPPPPPTSADDQAALQRIANAGAGDGTPPGSPDRREQLRKEMAEAGRRGDLQEMDRISTEFSAAGGYEVVGPQ